MGGTTSADIRRTGVFTWFTPAGYVFAIWSLIYVAMVVWLVAYTRTAPVRADPLHHDVHPVHRKLRPQRAVACPVALRAGGRVVHRHPGRVAGAGGAVPERAPHDEDRLGTGAVSIYTAWVTVATLANMAILVTRALDGGIPFFNGLFTILLTAGVLAFGYVELQGLRQTWRSSSCSCGRSSAWA